MPRGKLIKPRLEERLAAEIMTATWRDSGDPRTASHTGAGHGPDVTVHSGARIVGVAELSVDDDPAVRQAQAELTKAGQTISLPPGSGTWWVLARPDVHTKNVRRVLAAVGPRLAERDVAQLWVDQEEVLRRSPKPARPEWLVWDDPLMHVCRTLEKAGVVSVRSLVDIRGDVAHVAVVGGGFASEDGNVLSSFVAERMLVEPHASNVAKMRGRPGQHHVGLILGTATQYQRWDVYFPIAHQGGFPRPPRTAPAVPAGVTDVWVFHIVTGWAAWWTRDRGWTVHGGSENWWRHQTHFPESADAGS
jgi:hypothetical protein